VEFIMQLRGVPAAERRERALAILEHLGLAELADRRPGEMSGGQQQRVALARAIAPKPRLVLMDEPFSGLDAMLRDSTRKEVRAILKKSGMSAILVTHDQEEALEVSDRVVVMSQGQIEQEATPEDLYHQPANRFVYDFLGQVNVFQGTALGQQLQQDDAWVAFPEGFSPESGQLYLRSHEITLAQKPDHRAHLPLIIKAVNLIGAEVRLELEADGWRSEDLWEAGISHAEYNSWQPQRGERCYALPLAAQLFTPDRVEPRPLAWTTALQRHNQQTSEQGRFALA
jgi:sulfate transport system ATP-binding protein